MSPIERCHIHYTIYPKNKRLFDLANVHSVVAKFFEDALVESGAIPEDNYNHVVSGSYSFGEISKENPRCECEVIPLEPNQFIKQEITE